MYINGQMSISRGESEKGLSVYKKEALRPFLLSPPDY